MNKLRNILITIILLVSSFLSAQDCTDDATGSYTAFGGCDMIINVYGMACDAAFSGISVGDECPNSCNSCPGVCGDGSCDWDDGESYTDCPEDCDTPAACDDAVCLSILNTNTDAGTLDIYMKTSLAVL